MERLQKIMAQAGVASRRKCEELIVSGRVKVNGVTIQELGYKADAVHDEIEVDGKKIARENHVYFLLNKPTGYITSVTDPQGRKTVLDLMKGIEERIYPVGRLDYDTSGLLLLTNDGEFANRITHPRHELDKVYEATVRGRMEEDALIQLRQGIALEDGMTAPAGAVRLRFNEKSKTTLIRLTIHEGRNRQVRRMCEAVGHPVRKLKRVRLAFLTLEGVPEGGYRPLTAEEVARLYAL
ncbi:pseudouridine synthase [Aneurinibacillus aneurinilyticus]|uniref:Pseudouridine synthase n=1 Tax=Aneurinibacillus aneurinilyticus ATCC 12856 TaxID=649747 RepID=U1X500_ANEAE|nr:pseudouridine synthase [Aneurinibacillus aneurinilyticus]ERI10050.1 pseudouridine synthase B, ribosomal large subunit [Aneurinibacillus aneurinilyticus ATCC 12856]MED0708105.1 pseudouridine synthase [Aneurinibacillus aneurinilyticus]MED0726021.1 pseudouridine synthase [Aneurinibacillus aneurinilyticus]MED0732381.1 pseudouridine synthase [Aneurinibacillus aneurinilyticus]MED0741128.1 pseudouridine synthase [Aneurinibacillus aneurinilyticus]